MSITLQADPDDPSKKIAVLSVTFAEPIGSTNMVVRTWNTDSQMTTVSVFDALRMAEQSAEQSLEEHQAYSDTRT